MIEFDYVEALRVLALQMGDGKVMDPNDLFKSEYTGGCHGLLVNGLDWDVMYGCSKTKVSISYHAKCFHCWCEDWKNDLDCEHNDAIAWDPEKGDEYWPKKIFNKRQVLRLLGSTGQQSLF